MLDVRRLRLLRELAARRTVTAVAEALSYTPSAVSQQLAALERDAGVPLMERVGRGLQLTDAGRRLVTHADAVIAQLEAAEADLASAGGAVTGRVRIASFQTAAHALVIPAFDPLEARYPELHCELVQSDAETALPALRIGDVDMVLAEEYDHAPRTRDPALEHRELCRDALVFAVPDGHPAAAKDKIAFADLRDDEWAGGEPGTPWNDMIERACRSLGGYEPDVRHNVDDVRLILSLVAGHGAVGIVPVLGLRTEIEGFVTRPPAEGPLDRRIFTAVRRGTADRPALEAVRDELAEQARTLGLETVDQ
jgi:DNA-binding transcriptional LysR family regulator